MFRFFNEKKNVKFQWKSSWQAISEDCQAHFHTIKCQSNLAARIRDMHQIVVYQMSTSEKCRICL